MSHNDDEYRQNKKIVEDFVKMKAIKHGYFVDWGNAESEYLVLKNPFALEEVSYGVNQLSELLPGDQKVLSNFGLGFCDNFGKNNFVSVNVDPYLEGQVNRYNKEGTIASISLDLTNKEFVANFARSIKEINLKKDKFITDSKNQEIQLYGKLEDYEKAAKVMQKNIFERRMMILVDYVTTLDDIWDLSQKCQNMSKEKKKSFVEKLNARANEIMDGKLGR